jgi:hypothetical protein
VKIFRTADAFRARQREGPHRFTKNRPRTCVAALKSVAAVEKSKNQLSRDFRCRSIFDFCNSIRHKQPFHNHSFGESQNNQPIADDQSMLRRLFLVWPISSAAAFCRTAEALQHSMLATMEQEFHFSLISSSVNPRRTQSCAQCSGTRSKDPEKQQPNQSVWASRCPTS